MRSILYLWLILLANAGQLGGHEDHAIYLSTIEIKEHNDDVFMVVKVFEDDLRDALRSFHDQLIDPTADAFNLLTEAYFAAHLSVTTDNEKLDYRLASLELVGDSYQAKFNVPFNAKSNNIEIEASYFFELFPTQQNVLNMNLGIAKKYHIFRNSSRKKTFKLKD